MHVSGAGFVVVMVVLVIVCGVHACLLDAKQTPEIRGAPCQTACHAGDFIISEPERALSSCAGKAVSG
jgi:hypothetical protein